MAAGASQDGGSVGSRMPSLDGLRALAIIMVLGGHLEGTVGYPLRLRAWLGDYAHAGVQLFFVISGFLITTLLLRERQNSGGISLRLFYLRRGLRIMPALLAFLLAMTFASMLGWIHLTRLDLVTSYTYTTNYYLNRSWDIGHLWSLSVEEQFYLLWPLALAWSGSRRLLLGLCLGELLLAPLVRALLHVLLPHDPLRDLEIFPAVADAIAAGCLVALSREWLMRSPLYVRFTAGVWPWIALPLILADNRFNDRTVGDLLLSIPALLSLAVLVEALTRRTTGLASTLLNMRPVATLGVLSYSLYLWQQPFLNKHSTALASHFPLNLLLALAAAMASYGLLEKPLLRLRRHFAAPVRAAAAPRRSTLAMTAGTASAAKGGSA